MPSVLLLALLAVPGSAASPPPDRAEVALDFASLTVAQAHLRQGQRVRCRVVRDSATQTQEDGSSLFGCKSADGSLRSVWLRPGEGAGEEMTVEGVLRIRCVLASHGFAGFWHFTVTDARRAR